MATAAAVVAWVAWATWACKAQPYLDHRFLTLGSGRRSPAEMPGFFVWGVQVRTTSPHLGLLEDSQI